MKFNETQKNLIALLPAHEIIDKLTDSAKLVLAQIDLLHGTDFAIENGYVYTTNERLCKDTGVKARQTIITAVKVLRKLKLIDLESGGRHKANRYRLTDLYYELSGDENPFKNQAKETENQAKEEVPKNKNQAVDIELELEIELEPERDINNMLEYTCTGEDNAKNQHNMKIDERLITEDEKDAWEILDISDNFDYSQHEDVSRMVQSDAGNVGMMENPTYFEKKKNNEYVSKVFRKLSYYISEYKNSTSVEMTNDWGYKVNSLYGSLDRSKFTESQLGTISDMMDEFDYLYECKEKYLRKKYHKTDITKKTASNANIISTGTSDSEHCPSPAAPQKQDKKLNDDGSVNIQEYLKYWNSDEFKNRGKRTTQKEENRIKMSEVYAYRNGEPVISTTEEPIVQYDNSSINEAQQEFARALQKYA